MTEDTSFSYTTPVPLGIPTEKETLRRQAFQTLHPEVGFTYRASPAESRTACEEPWVAYWLPPAGKPRHITGKTLTEVSTGWQKSSGDSRVPPPSPGEGAEGGGT